MAMDEYITYAEVRSILGVESEELEDSVLALDLYSSSLLAEIEDVGTGIPAQFVIVAAIEPASRTDAQRRFYDATRNFAAYSVANQLSTSLPMFGPKEISDSKALVSRFTDSPFRDTISNVAKQLSVWRTRLSNAYTDLQSTVSVVPTRTFMVVSSPTTDPVIE